MLRTAEKSKSFFHIQQRKSLKVPLPNSAASTCFLLDLGWIISWAQASFGGENHLWVGFSIVKACLHVQQTQLGGSPTKGSIGLICNEKCKTVLLWGQFCWHSYVGKVGMLCVWEKEKFLTKSCCILPKMLSIDQGIRACTSAPPQPPFPQRGPYSGLGKEFLLSALALPTENPTPSKEPSSIKGPDCI